MRGSARRAYGFLYGLNALLFGNYGDAVPFRAALEAEDDAFSAGREPKSGAY